MFVTESVHAPLMGVSEIKKNTYVQEVRLWKVLYIWIKFEIVMDT